MGGAGRAAAAQPGKTAPDDFLKFR